MADETTFSQAQVDKIVRERLAEMKGQRDDARDKLAELEKAHGALTKERDTLQVRAERADAFESELKAAREEMQASAGRWGKEKALLGILGEKYDDDVAQVIFAKYEKAEDAGDFGEWAQQRAEAREGMFGLILGQKPAAEAVTQTTQTQTAQINPAAPPKAPAVNGGTTGAPPPAGAAVQRGSIASMPPAEWAALKAQIGLGGGNA